MKFCELIMPEVRFYLEEANFTEEERELFLRRTKDETLESCAEHMNVSVSTAIRLQRKVQAKVRKLNKN